MERVMHCLVCIHWEPENYLEQRPGSGVSPAYVADMKLHERILITTCVLVAE